MENLKATDHILLTGFQNCGKSTYGRKLATELKLPFIDSDIRLEKLYKEKWGEKANCRAIAKMRGIAFFRALEEEVIASLHCELRSVIALGGGTLLSEKNRTLVETMGTLLYLDVDVNTLKERMEKRGAPTSMQGKSFETFYAERCAHYMTLKAERIEIQAANWPRSR